MTTDTQKAIDHSILSDQLAKLFGFADGVSDIVEHLFTIDSKDVSCGLLHRKESALVKTLAFLTFESRIYRIIWNSYWDLQHANNRHLISLLTM
jgi:hypothetical protein